MNLKKIMSGAAAFIMTASLMTSYPTGCFKGLVVPVSVGAEESLLGSGTCGENLTWKLTTDGVLTISGSGEMYNFGLTSNLPTWDDYDDSKDKITSVVICEGVTSIGSYAFNSCKNLGSVNLPNSLKTICGNAFDYCDKLESIIIPRSVSYIGNQAFFRCAILSHVTVALETKMETTAFFKCSSSISYNYEGSCGPNATYTLDSQGNLVISGSGDISSYAFQDWTNITKVVIGDEITYIGAYAFDNCTGIDNIKIGENVTGIGSYAINRCDSLTSIVFPNSVYSVPTYFIANCRNLTSITAPCKLKTALSSYNDITTYTHPVLNEKCICTNCGEPLHTYTTDPHKCDKCENTSAHTDEDINGKCDICGKDIVRIKVAPADEKIYAFGDSVTITAPTAETGMTFDCWTAPNGKVVSRDAEYTFNAVVDNTYTPNYTPSKSSETMTIVWLSAYGQEMKRVTDTEDNLKSVEEPNVPTRLGYETTGWEKKTADIPFESGTTVIINAVYKELPQTYKINVTNGTADKTEYTAAQVATITADEKAGQKFSYWQEENGNIVSYSSTYKFYVSKNMKLTAVYDIVVEESKGTADIVQKTYSNATNKISIVSQLTVPDGCTMVYAGLVGTLDESIAKDLNKGNAKYIKGSTNTSYKSLRYTWTVGKAKDVTVYVKAYLTYTDSNGKLHEVYGKTYKCVGSEEVEIIEY